MLQVVAASGNRTHDLVVRRKHEDHRAIAAQTSESHAMDADSGGIYSNMQKSFLHGRFRIGYQMRSYGSTET